ncbi:MAG: hypothetical protein E6F96_07195 [Actinobacteria bacterium]|nr:MAG: hypothetical protein E6F96_07195 [Actinomycetota bacterium]
MLSRLQLKPATCTVAALMVLCAGGCGKGASRARSSGVRAAATPRGPALGLTEDNANLLWSPHGSPRPAAAFQPVRQELTALHPRYLRLLVDWAALQPDPREPPALEAPASGCARQVGPCGRFAGIRDELAAIASQQRAAGTGAVGDFQVVIDIYGTPAWAAGAPSGCERSHATAFSRAPTHAAITAYRTLIRSLLALAAREGVALQWWSPWNEPNHAVFLSPQHSSCAADSRPLSPALYAELARAMAAELLADGGEHHLLLGELNAFQSDSRDHLSVSRFVSALPSDVVCLGDIWSIHAYASRGAASPRVDPVADLEAALNARGGCARSAQIWVTETGAGAPHPGSPRPAGAADEEAGCQAMAAQLIRWYHDPRVGAVFQYTFREDPAFPVGLIGAELSHLYPTYRLWQAWSRLRAAGRPPPTPAAGCA